MEQLLYANLTSKIIKLAINVHRELGPGLLENTYKQCLTYELNQANIHNQLEVDLLIENKIILELKSTEKILPIHEAQLLTYLKLSNKKVGLLINFNTPLLKNGIKRLIL